MSDGREMDRTAPVDEALLDRFFERQRREILGRIEALERPRRRGPQLALAASALLAALLGAGVLGLGPTGSADGPDLSLWTMSSYASTGGTDPLSLYGDWTEQEESTGPLAAFGPLADEPLAGEGGESVLDIPLDWMIEGPGATTGPAREG